MRKTISVRGVDLDAIDLLDVIRLEERRLVGALISDAIRLYYDSLYFENDIEDEADEHSR